MKKHTLQAVILFLAGLALLSGCKEDDVKPLGAFKNATFIVCEGNFGSNDASIYAIVSDTLKKEIFAETNSRPLGDVVQSMAVIGNKAYLVVNNSGKVEVVDANTFESKGTAKGFSYPRYVAERNEDEFFVSNGNITDNSYVYVVNNSSLEITDSVKAGTGPNAMVVSNGKLFIANMGGGSNDSTVTVIDVHSLNVEQTIKVGDIPADLEVDAQGNVLVLCKGLTKYNYDDVGTYLGSEIVSNSSIVEIDASSFMVNTIKSFDHQLSCYGENVMTYNNGTIFYLDGGVYSLPLDSKIETKINDNVNAYGISYDTFHNGFWVMSTPYGEQHTASFYKSGTLNSYVLSKTYNVGNFPKMMVVNQSIEIED